MCDIEHSCFLTIQIYLINTIFFLLFLLLLNFYHFELLNFNNVLLNILFYQINLFLVCMYKKNITSL